MNKVNSSNLRSVNMISAWENRPPGQTLKEFLDSGGLCQACGACCGDVSWAPVTLDDIQRLMTAYNLPFEQARKMVYVENNELYILISKSGACPALDHSSEDKYSCTVYENRPAICRTYRCSILKGAYEWLESGGKPSSFSSYSCCWTEREVVLQAAVNLPSYCDVVFWDHKDAEDKPNFFEDLSNFYKGETLFKNTYPPEGK